VNFPAAHRPHPEPDLFVPAKAPAEEALGPGATLLRGFALRFEKPLLAALRRVAQRAPFRHMRTPGGHRMSVAMTNCGSLGWVTDETGYRYTNDDPETGRRWPAMPVVFRELAAAAADRAGFPGYPPDSCLINCYEPGARLSLHQDRNELDFGQPIVSVSLGLPATFLFGGARRKDRPRRVPLLHGDVGGPARLFYHGVCPLCDGCHPLLGRRRLNLTFRKAG
jgi:alkylated DNA repair protein (DNA oxidative demethylase)